MDKENFKKELKKAIKKGLGTDAHRACRSLVPKEGIKASNAVIEEFNKLEYQGFKILYSTSEFIHYQIDIQVIRKLKLKKLDNSIKRNSIEDRLSQLIDRSEEKEETEMRYNNSSYWTYYSSGDPDLAQNIIIRKKSKR